MIAAGKPPSPFAVAVAALAASLHFSGTTPAGAQTAAKPATRAAPAAPSGRPTQGAAPKKPAPTSPRKPPAESQDRRPSPEKRPAPTAPAPAPLPPKLPPLPPIDTSKPPPLLPRASRERMRACAEEWAEMKRKTKGGLPMWRDFAADCLTR